MPRPRTPYRLDNISLGGQERADLESLIDVIYKANPIRSAIANLSQAEDVFRMMFDSSSGKWLKKPYFRIGVNGSGPVVYPSTSE